MRNNIFNRCLFHYRDTDENSHYLISADDLSVHRIDSERVFSMDQKNKNRVFNSVLIFLAVMIACLTSRIYRFLELKVLYIVFIIIAVTASCFFVIFQRRMQKSLIDEILHNSDQERIEKEKLKKILSYNSSFILLDLTVTAVGIVYVLQLIRECITVSSFSWFIKIPVIICGIVFINSDINPVSVLRLYLKINKNGSNGI
ncbi:MAG: hypothetical protein IKF68_05700 [Erysipelotrichaceae bacterium]|nr:hypothetical protein [Erysipelotrichaceae bacterium]